MFIKIAMLVIFFSVLAGIGIYCRKHASSTSQFVLGGRNVGPWMTAFAYGTTYFSAVVFVGYAGQFGWNFGVSAAWIGLGNALIGSLLAWIVLARRTRLATKHYESATMPDFFAKRYNSANLRVIVSVIIFVFLVPYSASVYKGLSGLFSMAFGIDFIYCIIGMAVITAIYVILGGYMAAVVNDFLQGIIMLAGIVAVIFSVLNVNGGLMESLNLLSQIPANSAAESTGALTSLFGPDPLSLLSVIILTSLGAWGLPQMVHKFYTIKSTKIIKTGAIVSTIFAIVVAGGSYFMGSFGRLFYTPNGAIQYDAIVPQMLSVLPELLIGLVVILVLSASMSTLSSLVITSSSTFTLDFLKPLLKNGMKPKSEVLIIRALCGFFVLLSVIIAINPNSLITSLMSLSWGVLAGSFLGPFIYGLYWKGTTKLAVYASFTCAIIINVWNLLVPFTTPPNAGALSIVASLIIVPLVSFITPKLKKEHVEDAFSCYTKENREATENN